MSQPTSIQPDDQSQSERASSPGRRLRALRDARGMEIERIAAQLHLDRGVIEALERDEFERLPSPVFVGGYLRNYARLLGADPKPIMEAYNAMRPDLDAPLRHSAARTAGKPGPHSGGPWGWIVGLVLAVVAAGLIGIWWQGRSPVGAETSTLAPSEQTAQSNAAEDRSGSGGTNEASSEAPEQAPVDSFGSSVSVPPDAIPLRGTETTSQTAAPPTSSQGAEATAKNEETIPAASLPKEAPAQPEQQKPTAEAEPKNRDVVLQFSGTSWVDVRDATGEVVLNGEMREGDRRVLTGKPPYKLVIGNAAATQLSVGGKPFDLDSRARGNVARFSLDPNATE